MSKLFAHRNLGTVAKTVFQFPHYRAAANMLLRYERPLDTAARYLFGSGVYPAQIRIKTPMGTVEPTVYSYHDILTINEIFCRGDYRCPSDVKTIVDFGSNIGISALYFLTRNRDTYIYLFEPLPQNSDRLRRNLRGFEGRYELSAVAVALADGEAEFGYESTGRYGGISLVREKSTRVSCRAGNNILNEILDRHGTIDVLKIDIESLERDLLLSIPPDMLPRIKNIFMEVLPLFERNPLPLTHKYRRYGGVARFHRRSER